MLRYFLAVFLFVVPVTAHSHFETGTKIRTIVISGDDRIYVRVPAPLAFADVIAEANTNQAPLSTEYLYLEQTGQGARYRMSASEVISDDFRGQIAKSLLINGLVPRVDQHRLLLRDPRSGFDTPDAAHTSIIQNPTKLDPVFSEAMIEYSIQFDTSGPLSIQSGMPEIKLPGGVTIDNHIIDARRSGHILVMITGQLIQPFETQTEPLQEFESFLWRGVSHILTGPDHILLVVCLAIGLGFSVRLFWVVSAFTLGHSVTLALGVLGYSPLATWFIPVVEIGIAASVAFAAVAVWQGTSKGSVLAQSAIGGAVGLLHGLGFASFLSESLEPESPHLVASLIGFNVGIEFGQIAIVAITLAVLWALKVIGARPAEWGRLAILLFIALIASFWTIKGMVALA